MNPFAVITIIAMLGSAAVIGLQIKEASAALKLDFEYKGFSVKKIGSNYLDTVLTFMFINPTKTNLKLSALYVEIFYKGQLISIINNRTGIEIKANSKSNAEFPIQIKNEQFVSSIVQLVKTKDVNIDLKGHIEYYSAVLNNTLPPIPFTYTLNLKEAATDYLKSTAGEFIDSITNKLF